MSEPTSRPTTIAFYLPQFYPIPENDAWYGPGFTEWRNVVQARPLFSGHYQPHLPGELGFYDLRLPQVRAQQARLARQHGIDAFCYYHYWFHGHRPLRGVIDDALADVGPDIPFCLAWANENWSRHWDASRHEVLLRQTYSAEDDEAHGRFLLQAMSHPRYLRVDGKPIFFIYRIESLPRAAATLEGWRTMWRNAGLGEVQIVQFETRGFHEPPADFGADASAQFLPHGVAGTVPMSAPRDSHPGNLVFSYKDVARTFADVPQPAWRRYECVVPAWDNTPRRGDGASLLLHGSTPQLYRDWLAAVHAKTPADGVVLINAWNEWAEGAHLEPDLRYGREYLEATADAVGVPLPGPQPFGVHPEIEPPVSEADFGADPAHELKRMMALYLEGYESQVQLRRQLARLEATLERQVEFATRDALAQAAEARAQALKLSREVERLSRLTRPRPTEDGATGVPL